MRNRMYYIFFFVLLCCASLSACARSKSFLFSQNSDTMVFHFGQTGAAKVDVNHSLSMDGYRAASLTPILTEVVQNRLEARGFAVTEAKPSAGGWSQLDEFKLNGRSLVLEFSWGGGGSLSATGAFYTSEKATPTLTLWLPSVPAVISRHYADSESFYHGVKSDIAPIVDDAIDFILNDLKKEGMPNP
jgi:hypothetical protein